MKVKILKWEPIRMLNRWKAKTLFPSPFGGEPKTYTVSLIHNLLRGFITRALDINKNEGKKGSHKVLLCGTTEGI